VLATPSPASRNRAVCLGLFVIVSQPTRPELTRAYDQARDIAGLNWDSDSLNNMLDKATAADVDSFQRIESPATGAIDGIPSAPGALEISGQKYNVSFDARNWGFPLPPATSKGVIRVGRFNGAQVRLSRPKNLADFRMLWDGIQNLTAWGGGHLARFGSINRGSPFGGTDETWFSWKLIPPSPRYTRLSHLPWVQCNLRTKRLFQENCVDIFVMRLFPRMGHHKFSFQQSMRSQSG
jgi:hypothetical protein